MERFFVTSPISDYRFPMDLSGWFSSESVKREKRREIAGVIQYKVESTGIELPKLRYYGDSQMNTLVEKVDSLSTFEETQNDNGNGNNNDENFNNNNDFNCLNSNSTECVEILPSLEQQNSLTVEISEETIEDNHNLIDDISFDDNIMHDLASDSMLLVEKVLDFVDEMNVLEKACKNYDYINEFKTDNGKNPCENYQWVFISNSNFFLLQILTKINLMNMKKAVKCQKSWPKIKTVLKLQKSLVVKKLKW